MVQTNASEHFFDAWDGLRLFSRRWLLEKPKGLVVIIHGFAEHCGRYQWVADRLNQAGWSVAAFDYRGHGQSGGRRAHINRFDDYLKDVRSFLDDLARAGNSLPPVILGHSLGGLIAARFSELEPDRIKATILSSPFLGLAMKVPALKALGGKLLSGMLPTFSMKTNLNAAWLSHDREVVENYSTDPLVSNIVTARWFTEVSIAQESTLEHVSKLKRPLLLLQAGEDHLASPTASRNFYNAAQISDKTFHLYEGFYHEILNEVGREKVIEEMINWLEKYHP